MESRTSGTSVPGLILPAFPSGMAVLLIFGGVLHVLDLVDLDVLALAINFLHTTDVDILHDVAGVCVN